MSEYRTRQEAMFAETPGTMPVDPDGECNGCAMGWPRYTNPHGLILHRNWSGTLEMMCWADEPAEESQA